MLCRAVASRIEESMQDGQEDGSLGRESESLCFQKLLEHGRYSQLVPEAIEDEGGAQFPRSSRT